MYCEKQWQLIEAVCVASERYYNATTQLVSLAGKSLHGVFANAKIDCYDRLGDCQRAKAALRLHKAAHGC